MISYYCCTYSRLYIYWCFRIQIYYALINMLKVSLSIFSYSWFLSDWLLDSSFILSWFYPFNSWGVLTNDLYNVYIPVFKFIVSVKIRYIYIENHIDPILYWYKRHQNQNVGYVMFQPCFSVTVVVFKSASTTLKKVIWIIWFFFNVVQVPDSARRKNKSK